MLDSGAIGEAPPRTQRLLIAPLRDWQGDPVSPFEFAEPELDPLLSHFICA
jgi:hypothetical protein